MPIMGSYCALFWQVKYRTDGDVAKTICHVDEKAKDIDPITVCLHPKLSFCLLGRKL